MTSSSNADPRRASAGCCFLISIMLVVVYSMQEPRRLDSLMEVEGRLRKATVNDIPGRESGPVVRLHLRDVEYPLVIQESRFMKLDEFRKKVRKNMWITALVDPETYVQPTYDEVSYRVFDLEVKGKKYHDFKVLAIEESKESRMLLYLAGFMAILSIFGWLITLRR